MPSRAVLYREGKKGFTVWTIKPYTGDKADCLGWFTRKASALKVLRAHNRKLPIRG